MKNTDFVEMATKLAAEGDHLAASILCFVGALHFAGDQEALRALAVFAGELSHKNMDTRQAEADWPNVIDG